MILLRTIKKLYYVNKIFYSITTQSKPFDLILGVINNFKLELVHKKNNQIEILKSSLEDIKSLSTTEKELFYRFIIVECNKNHISYELLEFLKNNNYFQHTPYLLIQVNMIKIQKCRNLQEKQSLFTENNQIVQRLSQEEKKKYLSSIAILNKNYGEFLHQKQPDQALKLLIKSIKQFQELLKNNKEQIQKQFLKIQNKQDQKFQLKLRKTIELNKKIVQYACNALITCFTILYKKRTYHQCQKFLKIGLALCKHNQNKKLRPFYNLTLIKLDIELRWKYKKQNKEVIVKQFKSLCQYLQEFIKMQQKKKKQILKACLYLYVCRRYLYKLQNGKDIDLKKFSEQNQNYVNQLSSKHPQIQKKWKNLLSKQKKSQTNQKSNAPSQ